MRQRRGAVPLRPHRSTPARLLLFLYLAAWLMEFSWDTMMWWYGVAEWYVGFGEWLWHERPVYYVSVVVALLYGGHRVVWYHPLYQSRYLAWLSQMPWEPGRPLPFGTILPTWVDAVLLALLALSVVAVHPVWGPASVLTAAIGAYVLTHVFPLSLIGLHRHVYLILALVGAGLIVQDNVWALLATALAGLCIAIDGARRTLARMPRQPGWKPDTEMSLGFLFLGPTHMGGREPEKSRLEWPYASLSSRDPAPKLSRERAILIPLVVGWLFYAFLQLISDVEGAGLGLVIGFLIAMGRLGLYAGFRLWPVSFAGRIRLGLWIIPRYDVVFIGPLIALAGAVMASWVLAAAGASPALLNAAPVAVALWAVLLSPPSLGRWELTGAYHMSIGQMR